MELNESEICDVMAKAVVDFVDDEFSDWTDDEKLNLKRLLITFSCRVRDGLVDAETAKLDKMAEASE